MSDTYDTADTESDESEDSPVIKELRAQIRTEAKARQKAEDKLAQVETAEQTRRADSAEKIMNTFGLPGLKDDVLEWVEGSVTEASVAEALKQRSIPLPEELDLQDGVEPQDEQVSASQVGQRVADAAGGRDQRTLDELLNDSDGSPAEIAKIMSEAGLTRSHS